MRSKKSDKTGIQTPDANILKNKREKANSLSTNSQSAGLKNSACYERKTDLLTMKSLQHENRELKEELKIDKFILEAQSGTIHTLEGIIQMLLKDSESDILQQFEPFFKVNKKTPVNDTDVDKMTDDQINELIEKKNR